MVSYNKKRMTKISKLSDIDIYRDALILAREIYVISRSQKLIHDFSLIDQIRRACLSVAANIAEGYGRKTKRDFAQFLSIALGSVNEVITYLDFINLEYNINIEILKNRYEILAKRIFVFRRYLLLSS